MISRGCVPPQLQDLILAAYSAIRHFAYSVWLGAYRPRNLLAMFTAYFDESGNETDNNGTLTVAGSISTVQQWLHFDDAWKVILKRYAVSVFHMQECAMGTGEYKGWDTDKRRKLIGDLASCLKRHAKYATSATVVLEGWNRINSEYQLSKLFGHPYTFCGRLCVAGMSTWIEAKNYRRVEYIFENGAKRRGELTRFLEQKNGIIANFKEKALTPLQAADLIAWKNHRIVHDLVKRPYSMTRQQLDGSLRPVSLVPHKYWVQDEKELLSFCQRHNVPRL